MSLDLQKYKRIIITVPMTSAQTMRLRHPKWIKVNNEVNLLVIRFFKLKY